MSDYAIEPPVLIQATMGAKREQACSPALPHGTWAGVLISGPSRLRGAPGEELRIPVCGRYHVPIAATIRPVARLHLRISGLPPIAPQAVSLEDPRDEVGRGPPLSHPGQVSIDQNRGGLFAVDLGPYIHLPPLPARVEYAIEFGGHTSAVQSFEWHPVLPQKVPPRR